MFTIDSMTEDRRFRKRVDAADMREAVCHHPLPTTATTVIADATIFYDKLSYLIKDK
jgi:hypothetical protein